MGRVCTQPSIHCSAQEGYQISAIIILSKRSSAPKDTKLPAARRALRAAPIRAPTQEKSAGRTLPQNGRPRGRRSDEKSRIARSTKTNRAIKPVQYIAKQQNHSSSRPLTPLHYRQQPQQNVQTNPSSRYAKPSGLHNQPNRHARKGKAPTEAIEDAVRERLQVARPAVRDKIRLPRAHGGVRAPPRPPRLRVRGPLHEFSTRQHLCLYLLAGTNGYGGGKTHFHGVFWCFGTGRLTKN